MGILDRFRSHKTSNLEATLVLKIGSDNCDLGEGLSAIVTLVKSGKDSLGNELDERFYLAFKDLEETRVTPCKVGCFGTVMIFAWRASQFDEELRSILRNVIESHVPVLKVRYDTLTTYVLQTAEKGMFSITAFWGAG